MNVHVWTMEHEERSSIGRSSEVPYRAFTYIYQSQFNKKPYTSSSYQHASSSDHRRLERVSGSTVFEGSRLIIPQRGPTSPGRRTRHTVLLHLQSPMHIMSRDTPKLGVIEPLRTLHLCSYHLEYANVPAGTKRAIRQPG